VPFAAVIAFVRSRRGRGILAQMALVLVVGAIVYLAVSQAQSSIAKQGIRTGFAFLNNTAGFDIVQHLIPYSEESTFFDVLIVGLLNTVLVAVVGIVLATIIGLIVGIGSLSSNWLVSRMCVAYVETLRNVPLLLQIFFWYFAVLRALPGPADSVPDQGVYVTNRGLFLPWFDALPGSGLVFAAIAFGLICWIALGILSRNRRIAAGEGFDTWLTGPSLMALFGIGAAMATGFPFTPNLPQPTRFDFEGGLAILPELFSLIMALSLYTGSYIAEIVRAGIQGVAKGQTEAARSLGLSRAQALRLVIVPQALRQIIPPLTSTYLGLTKNSSLAVAIAYPDLVSVFAGTTLNQTGQAIEVLTITMLIYLSLSLITSLLMNSYNAQIAKTVQR
jgi:general L-amino acid transport system permease protein